MDIRRKARKTKEVQESPPVQHPEVYKLEVKYAQDQGLHNHGKKMIIILQPS